jgi:hypothetical protein
MRKSMSACACVGRARGLSLTVCTRRDAAGAASVEIRPTRASGLRRACGGTVVWQMERRREIHTHTYVSPSRKGVAVLTTVDEWVAG